ncbi:MAG: hypothetical protein ABIJ57_02285 [Pseudomonadota bacterium]
MLNISFKLIGPIHNTHTIEVDGKVIKHEEWYSETRNGLEINIQTKRVNKTWFLKLGNLIPERK